MKVGSVLEGNFEDLNNIWQLLLCLKDARYLIGFDWSNYLRNKAS